LKRKAVYLICASLAAAIVYSAAVCGFAAKPAAPEAVETVSTEGLVVQAVCGLINEGEFDAAEELMEQTRGPSVPESGYLEGLSGIVKEYKEIARRREEARRTTYAEKTAELERFRESLFGKKSPQQKRQAEADVNDANNVDDINDVNDISKVLSTIAQASEFADEEQKRKLVSGKFVQDIFQKAKDNATRFESEGKWLDAYISCYSWLQAIDKDNETYSEYVEQLIDKAEIEASFQDSPCEKLSDRFEGIEEQMFIRAVDTLSLSYVSIIDYRQMANKAVRRCRLLGEVIRSSSVVREKLCNERCDEKVSAWSAAMSALLDEINESPSGISKEKLVDIFEKVLAINTTTLELPAPVVIAQFAEASLSALDDYTIIVWPSQTADFEKEMMKEFSGIGILITREKGLLTVESLLPDTPAYKSGLDADDVIEKIDGVSAKDMSLGCAVKYITGQAGTKVTLTIRRPGEEQGRDITITRAKIVVPPIRGWQRAEESKWLYMIDEQQKIGYVRITSFDSRTGQDLEEILRELEKEGMKGLIIDLRFNTGGLLSSAIEVTDMFLEEGPIVITRPRSWVSATYAMARKEGTHPDYPLVVLVNRFSASASEIVAGALADKIYRRAVLVGDRTHGKGSVQGITSYPGGRAELKYTMAYYYLPSGQRVESQEAMKKSGRKDWGVSPNIEIELSNNELRKMSEVQRDNEVLVKADHDQQASPLKRHSVEETLAADLQLAVGVLAIKSKLIQEASLVANKSACGGQELNF